MRKKRYGLWLHRAGLEHFNGFTPRRLLTGIYLSQVEHVSLHDLAATIHTAVFDQAPIMMLFNRL